MVTLQQITQNQLKLSQIKKANQIGKQGCKQGFTCPVSISITMVITQSVRTRNNKSMIQLIPQ